MLIPTPMPASKPTEWSDDDEGGGAGDDEKPGAEVTEAVGRRSSGGR